MRSKSHVGAAVFAVVALIDALVFLDLFITKIRGTYWVQYVFIACWGVSACGCAIAARALLERSHRSEGAADSSRL